MTDVIFSHHHPDHTINAALFQQARIHDFQATYVDDEWTDRDFDGGVEQLSPSVRLLLTPGHTPQDISTVRRDRRRAWSSAPTSGGRPTDRSRTRTPRTPRSCGPRGSWCWTSRRR